MFLYGSLSNLVVGTGNNVSLHWEVHPQQLTEDGEYDPEGVRLAIAQRQVEELHELAKGVKKMSEAFASVAGVFVRAESREREMVRQELRALILSLRTIPEEVWDQYCGSVSAVLEKMPKYLIPEERETT